MRKDGRILLYKISDVANSKNESAWQVEFEWDFGDCIGHRCCITDNPNVVVFMEDMLKRLGHKKTERKIW